MDKELQRSLDALRSKLRETGAAEPENEALWRDLDRDIEALARREPIDAAHPSSLDEQLRAIQVRFKNRHPRLEPILEELANMLASIGI